MKKITLFLCTFAVTLLVGCVTLSFATTSTANAASKAPDACAASGSFFGFKAWYNTLTVVNKATNSCDIKSPSAVGGLSIFIWTIVLNIIDDLLMAVGFASVGYIMWGGFRYMTSEGSSAGMARAKSQILNAIIGLVISVVSVAIVRLVVGSF